MVPELSDTRMRRAVYLLRRKRMTNVDNFNDQSIGEEIANAISHGLGAVLAIAGAAVLVVYSCLYSDTTGIVSASAYGFSLIFLFLMSTLYHALTNPRAKKVFQIFDHCSIFILIIGSYVPICLSLLRGTLGRSIFFINVVFAVLGIVANAISVKRWHKLSLVLYLLMGWSVVFALQPLFQLVSWGGLLLLVGGGILYSVGVLFYRAEKPRFMHTIWHLFVLAGSALHYFFILFYAL